MTKNKQEKIFGLIEKLTLKETYLIQLKGNGKKAKIKPKNVKVLICAGLDHVIVLSQYSSGEIMLTMYKIVYKKNKPILCDFHEFVFTDKTWKGLVEFIGK